MVYYLEDNIFMRVRYSNLNGEYLQMSVYKVESQETILEQEIMLSATRHDIFDTQIKDALDVVPFGTYNLDIKNQQNRLLARSVFYINEK